MGIQASCSSYCKEADLKQTLVVFLMSFWATLALAQAEAPEGPSFFVQAIPFLAMFFIFYFLVMRPQVQKQKTHQEFLQGLKKGDRVLTSSGIFGTIEGLTEKYVKLEIADDVSIRVLKAHVSQSVKEG
jgi:preprotein translocase subunit YajC